MFGFFDWCCSGLTIVQTADSKRIAALEKQITEARQMLEQIVCTEEPDDGVLLLDHESPTYFSPSLRIWIYKHEHFSPLGDALIALHNKLKE